MKNYYDVLVSLGACKAACEARKNMSIEEAMESAERGDWILWLASKLKLNHRKITLAKARSVATVKHLMKDERSIKAVEMAEQYGLGNASEEDLKIAADAADAVYAVYADAAAYAAYAAAAAAAYAAAAYAAYAAADAAYAAAAYADAKKENQLKTAKICVEILGEDIISEVNKRITSS